jgi:hypothetical protein
MFIMTFSEGYFSHLKSYSTCTGGPRSWVHASHHMGSSSYVNGHNIAFWSVQRISINPAQDDYSYSSRWNAYCSVPPRGDK